jgi:ribosome-associated toxin RatA of RatAB toxin-antitoxin module
MRTVNRSALVPFTAEAMFNLVKDVEAYPEFLPWCTQTRLQSKDESELVATLTVGFGAMNSEFTTHNHFNAPDWMTMRLLEGPFSALEGRWGFEQLSDDGCEVTLRMEFDFSSAVKDALLGAVFEKICNELIDAFIKRAHDLYG